MNVAVWISLAVVAFSSVAGRLMVLLPVPESSRRLSAATGQFLNSPAKLEKPGFK